MERLQSWIMSNYITQGYNMHFEDLSIESLNTLRDLAAEAILDKKQAVIDEIAEKREKLQQELQEIESEIENLEINPLI